MIRDLTHNEMMGTLQILTRVFPKFFGSMTALQLFELYYDINLADFIKAIEIDGFINKITEYWETNQAPVLTPIYQVYTRNVMSNT